MAGLKKTEKISDKAKAKAIWKAHGVYCEGYCCMKNPDNKIYNGR